MPVEIHELQFHRNRVSGNFRALCTCGWCRVGTDEAEVRGQAATHDIEWIAVETAADAPTSRPEPAVAPTPPAANDAFWTGRQ